MKKIDQLRGLFGRELTSDELMILSRVFGRSTDSIVKEEAVPIPHVQAFNNLPVASMFSGKRIVATDMENSWQGFVTARQELLEDQQATITYLHYNKGFADGLRLAVLLGQL
ncbi:hypothetical protein [Sporomusa sphaeroides]|uniref:Uncharacterized protein n=1 Tax=Sporomusa sphaeroides DSM 2875 TaxID=1337886 RepID=A0ABP2C2T9_9FIRM|nr:hypothetical protein [Sporomusa sphaeroides]OLS56823.1 hypothetical protein SPSPH_03130 [Sporomusa sphaeroides DSM 2875]CVK18770.1 hypothetical protein SSPH_01414 [Sporomusa sphaeroides DSM 2875]